MPGGPKGLAVRKHSRFGWRPDTPGMRGFMLAVEPGKALPKRASLGSCTANSIGAILEFNELEQDESNAALAQDFWVIDEVE